MNDKPVECPHCKEEISGLNYSDKAVRFMSFYLSDYNGEAICEYDLTTLESDSEEEYHCPECDKLIAESEEVAKAFLNGEISFEWEVVYYSKDGEELDRTHLDEKNEELAREQFYDEFGHSKDEKIYKIDFNWVVEHLK